MTRGQCMTSEFTQLLYVTVTVFTQFSHRPPPGKQILGGKIGACRLGRPRGTRAEMAPAGAAISPAGK